MEWIFECGNTMILHSTENPAMYVTSVRTLALSLQSLKLWIITLLCIVLLWIQIIYYDACISGIWLVQCKATESRYAMHVRFKCICILPPQAPLFVRLSFSKRKPTAESWTLTLNRLRKQKRWKIVILVQSGQTRRTYESNLDIAHFSLCHPVPIMVHFITEMN